MGILIGMIVGYTMTLQQSLFTQLPLKFEFPWVIMINVIISSIIFALLASFSPIRAVLNRRVVQIFRLLG
jgi:ABC-type antimicrobial peptide transport system permease subunit